MDQNLGRGSSTDDTKPIIDEGHYAWIAYDKAVRLRPVPAIEKPLGPRGLMETEEPIILIENS